MVLEIIVEYWSFMIFYFMLSSCRLSFQKIEILVIQIVCCHSCTQNSTFFAGIFLTHLLECLGAVNVWDGLTQSWMWQLFIIFGTHLTHRKTSWFKIILFRSTHKRKKNIPISVLEFWLGISLSLNEVANKLYFKSGQEILTRSECAVERQADHNVMITRPRPRRQTILGGGHWQNRQNSGRVRRGGEGLPKQSCSTGQSWIIRVSQQGHRWLTKLRQPLGERCLERVISKTKPPSWVFMKINDMANTRNQGVEHTTDLRFLLISDHLKPTLKSPAMQCSNIPLPSLVLTLERLHHESFTSKLFENASMFYPGNQRVANNQIHGQSFRFGREWSAWSSWTMGLSSKILLDS